MLLQVEEADAQVQELEAEQERLHRVNVDLSDRNSILEKYLQLKDSPEVSCHKCCHLAHVSGYLGPPKLQGAALDR